MTCPDCDSPVPQNRFGNDPVGRFDCLECRTPLIRTVYESSPRAVIKIPTQHKAKTPPASITGYPVKVNDSGSSTYRCVGCGLDVPIWGAEIGNITIGFTAQNLAVSHYAGPDGRLYIKHHSRPVIVRGPICPKCKEKK